jgi:hypothetical protein
MARRRRQFRARVGFADRCGHPERKDHQRQQQQEQSKALPDQRSMVEITRPRRNGSINIEGNQIGLCFKLPQNPGDEKQPA